MKLPASRQLKQMASRRLAEASYNPRRLALIHAGVALGCTLILTVINYILSLQLSGTGGLSGIRTRSVLMSAQSVLNTVVTVGLPLWEFGFVAAAMGFARQEAVGPRTLTKGFRWFGPIFRFLLLELALYALVLLLVSQLASVMVVVTVVSNETVELMGKLAQDPVFMETGVVPQELLGSQQIPMLPVYILTAFLYAVVAVPLSYWLRLTQYMILDGRRPRVLMAMRVSWKLMRGNCLAYFKLDLSFWWYWLLQVFCAALAFGDVLLPWLGISLPMEAEAAAFLFYGLKAVAALLLAWCWQAQVETTYALAYDAVAGIQKPTPQEQ